MKITLPITNQSISSVAKSHDKLVIMGGSVNDTSYRKSDTTSGAKKKRPTASKGGVRIFEDFFRGTFRLKIGFLIVDVEFEKEPHG